MLQSCEKWVPNHCRNSCVKFMTLQDSFASYEKLWVLESSSFYSDNFLCSFYPLILLSPSGITQAQSDLFSYNNITNSQHSSFLYFGLNIFNSPGEKKCWLKKLTLSKMSYINQKYRKCNSFVSFSLNRYSSDLVFLT